MGFTIRGHPVGWMSIYTSLVASVAGGLFGYDLGYTASILVDDDALLRFAANRKDCTWVPDGAGERICVPVWKPYLEGLFVGFLSIGCMIGAFCATYLADWLGRRRAIQIDAMINAAGIVIQASSQWTWVQFALGRLVAGVGVGALSATVPPYVAEVVPREGRGAFISFYQTLISVGLLLGYCVDLASRGVGGKLGTPHRSASWRIPVCVTLIFSLVLVTGIFFCPESPRWSAMLGHEDQVRKAVAITRGLKASAHHPLVEMEVAEIMAAARDERLRPAGFADCLHKQERMLYRTALCCMLQMLQQLSGANYFFYYGAQMFKPLRGNVDYLLSQVILGAVSLACELPGLYILEFLGRRRPLVVGSLWTAVWMLVWAVAGLVGNHGTPSDPKFERSISTLLLFSACMGLLGYSATWAPGAWLICGETGAPRTRVKQASLAAMSNWLINFYLAFFTMPIQAKIGLAYGLVFAGCNFFAAFFVYFTLYETSNLTLEQIGIMYNDPNCKPWTSIGWTPPTHDPLGPCVRLRRPSQPPASILGPPRFTSGAAPGFFFATTSSSLDHDRHDDGPKRTLSYDSHHGQSDHDDCDIDDPFTVRVTVPPIQLPPQ